MDLLDLGRRLRKVLVPSRLRVTCKGLAGRAERVLDAGRGNSSCEITRAWLNVAACHGIDREHDRGMQEGAVAGLARKVRPGGLTSLEAPSCRSCGFSSEDGFPDFHDDPACWRCRSVERLADIQADAGSRISGLGYQRVLVLHGPATILINLLHSPALKRRLPGTGLRDLLGVARCTVAERRLP